MDPDTALNDYRLAREAGDDDAARDALDALRQWKAKGGFAPGKGWPAELGG